MERFEVIVVGGGLAGLSSAYSLAKSGIEVLVIERGDYSGAKNVTGGRLYLNPVRRLLPVPWDEAPLERYVTRETLTMIGDQSSTSIQLSSGKFKQKPYHSYTVLRAKLDKWLAEKATEAGAMIVTKNKVDDLLVEKGKIVGVIAGDDQIGADVVIAADGVVSLVAEKAGLTRNHHPKDLAVAIKEVIEIPRQSLEQRFNLDDGDGVAQLFFGSLTKGMFGGGFLYTNLDSVSLGLVIRIDDLMKKEPPVQTAQIFEDFKKRPEINSLIRSGDTVEYSAHLIPENNFPVLSNLFSDGILVAGDAAGLALNAGVTVRGMEFAIASGVLAAEAIKTAREKKDYSKQSLSVYGRLLRKSFVWQDLNTFKSAIHFIDNPRLFNLYPQTICEIFEKLMFIGDQPKKKFSRTAFMELRKLGFSPIRDFFGVNKI